MIIFFNLYVNGTLIADGTGAPIIFTSFDDLSVGGATGSGNPAPDEWSAILFSSSNSGSLLDNVGVRYGGGFNSQNIFIETRSITLTNSATCIPLIRHQDWSTPFNAV